MRMSTEGRAVQKILGERRSKDDILKQAEVVQLNMIIVINSWRENLTPITALYVLRMAGVIAKEH